MDYLIMMDLLSKAIAHRLELACSITPLQYRILLRILADKTLRAKHLAQILGVSAPTASVAISKLADRNLIVRSDSADDMRSVKLEVSTQGRNLVKYADSAVYDVISNYLSSLTREQIEGTLRGAISAIELHSLTREEHGKLRLDTALVDTIFTSKLLTSRALEEHGIATVDFRALLALRIMGGSSSSTEMSSFLFLNSCDLTSSFKNLEAMGLVLRKRSAHDRRVRVIEMTDDGCARTAELLPVVFDALHETCRRNGALINAQISAARDMVVRKRQQDLI